MDLDVDQFMKDMESILKRPGEVADSNIEEGSSSDLDFGKIFLFIVTLYVLLVLVKKSIYRLRNFTDSTQMLNFSFGLYFLLMDYRRVVLDRYFITLLCL